MVSARVMCCIAKQVSMFCENLVYELSPLSAAVLDHLIYIFCSKKACYDVSVQTVYLSFLE